MVITLVFALLGYSVIPYNQIITISELGLWIVGLVLIWSVNSLFKSTNDFLDLSCSFFRYFFVIFILLAVSANFSIHESADFCLLSSPVLLSSLRPHTDYNNQARDIKMSDDEFAQWLSGFTDGEGNFYILIPKNNVISFRFKIKLHLDDKDVLVFIQSRLKCGNIITAQGKSYASFELTRIADI